jgi:penicillin-binding protein 2
MNHALADNIPAGSVFRQLHAGALTGVILDRYWKPPKLIVRETFSGTAGRPADSWAGTKPAGHLDFIGGISNSSNVYFYKLGGGYGDEVKEGLGICRLGTYARALGYGANPGTGFPGEEDGLIPDPRWKRITHGEGWSTGDTYISSVGQGYVLATPLQVLMSATTIANDGKLMQPTLVKEVIDGEGKTVPVWMNTDSPALTVPTTGAVQVSPFQSICVGT